MSKKTKKAEGLSIEIMENALRLAGIRVPDSKVAEFFDTQMEGARQVCMGKGLDPAKAGMSETAILMTAKSFRENDAALSVEALRQDAKAFVSNSGDKAKAVVAKHLERIRAFFIESMDLAPAKSETIESHELSDGSLLSVTLSAVRELTEEQEKEIKRRKAERQAFRDGISGVVTDVGKAAETMRFLSGHRDSKQVSLSTFKDKESGLTFRIGLGITPPKIEDTTAGVKGKTEKTE